MLKWLSYPLLRLSAAFLLGVFAGFELPFDTRELEMLWIALFGAYFWFTLKAPGIWFSTHKSWLAVLGLTVVFIAGIQRTQWDPHVKDPLVGSAEYYQSRVVEVSGSNNRSIILEIQWVWSKGHIFPANDQVRWFQSGLAEETEPELSTYKKLGHGDQIIIKGAPGLIRKPANPREFDYAAFMSRKNIFWQHWIEAEDMMAVFPNERNSINHLAGLINTHLQQVIERSLPTGPPQEITKAMLLGERSAVSENLEESFVRSGTIHVLAVSGLHLGILYWLLSQLFGRWRQHPILKWAFILICLSALWSFTLVTGMAASTQRAASMFSVLLLGNTLSKQSNSINTLGIAAMLILYADPYQLFAVGFQLSFLALGGILFIQPIFRKLWQPKNMVLKYFWELISVSLAAQVAVIPLSIYYFNQLPVYFLIANIFLVPLAFGIVVLGICFFIASLFSSTAMLVDKPLVFLTRMAATLVTEVSNFPGSTMYNLEMDYLGVLASYIMLAAALLYWKNRSKSYWMVMVLLLIISTAGETYTRLKIQHRQMIAVYHIPRHTAVDFFDGENYASLMDSQLAIDTATIEYKIENFRRYLKMETPSEQVDLFEANNTFESWIFLGKQVLMIKSLPPIHSNGNIKLKSDIVIVTNNSVRNLQKVRSWLEADLWIIDGSNKPWIADQLESQATKEGLNMHNCWTKGAKLINL